MDRQDGNDYVTSREAVPIWDLPTRLFHWIIVGLLLFSWYAAETGKMDWHRLSGYTVLTLLVFRVGWGVFGSETARFASFVRGPAAVLGYAKHFLARRPSHATGHNPLGALSVLALLALLLLQTGTGLFSVDTDGVESGPLAGLLSFDSGRRAAAIHGISFKLIQIAVVIHVVVVLFYAFWKRDNLVWPMLIGKKRLPGTVASPRHASPGVAVAWLAVSAALVYALVTWGPRLAKLM